MLEQIINTKSCQIECQMTEILDVRIDKWLWAARFFKTRQLAAEAVSGGKIHINTQRCKPGKVVKIDDLISISKDQNIWLVRVTSLVKQRLPPKEAVQLYVEDEVSKLKRLKQIEDQKQQALLNPFERPYKPNKKERRQIHRFKQEVG